VLSANINLSQVSFISLSLTVFYRSKV